LDTPSFFGSKKINSSCDMTVMQCLRQATERVQGRARTFAAWNIISL